MQGPNFLSSVSYWLVLFCNSTTMKLSTSFLMDGGEMIIHYFLCSVIFLFSSSLFAKEGYPSVGYESDNVGGRYCMKTRIQKQRLGSNTSHFEKEKEKCFAENKIDNTNDLRNKITVLAGENEISNEEFWTLVGNADSLKQAYFLIGQKYPITETCKKVVKKYDAEIDLIKKDYDYAKEMLSCNSSNSQASPKSYDSSSR